MQEGNRVWKIKIMLALVLLFLPITSGFLGLVKNSTIGGISPGCKYTTNYDTTSIVSFRMCTGQSEQDLKNGMSIINLIASRGYLPTCRIMQLMLWMFSEVHETKSLAREFFVDIGANIGSCSVHMASLGFPVIAVEPVQQHVDTIRGSIDINPSFHIDVNHNGLSSTDKSIRANFGHGARNWGATEFHEVSVNETFEAEIRLKSLDQVIGSRKVSLLKVDCEGCEWSALKGAKRTLKRIPMMKIELVQPEYLDGNETMSAIQILQFLSSHGFDVFVDKWAENHLYFGKHGNEILEIDRMFGSTKFKLASDLNVLIASAKTILSSKIDVDSFNQRNFLKSSTDIIAIEKSLSIKMKTYFGV